MAEAFRLGGRMFVPAAEGTTFEQDAYLMGLVLEHGINDVIQAGGDVVGRVLRSGAAPQLLAGLLTGVGETWSPEVATANARHFATIRAADEKAVLYDCLRGLLQGFSNAGAISSTASPTASQAGTQPTAKTSRRRTKRGRGSANGAGSVAPSATTTASG